MDPLFNKLVYQILFFALNEHRKEKKDVKLNQRNMQVF
jgi:hypothetical protein